MPMHTHPKGGSRRGIGGETMMNLLLYTQVAVSVFAFLALLFQIFWKRSLSLTSCYRATWGGIIVQIATTVIAAATVVAFGGEVEPLVLLPTLLLVVTNTAWFCTLNLLLTIMKR